jgi:hypothetical protein
MVVKWNSSVLTMNQNSHRLLFILNRYLVMRGEFDTHTPSPPTHCFSAGSCARIFGLLLLVDSPVL